MTKNTRRPKTIAIAIIMMVLTILLLHTALARIQTLYSHQFYTSAFEIRTHFIENTIKNIVTDIDAEREIYKEEFAAQMKSASDHVNDLVEETGEHPEWIVRNYIAGRANASKWSYLAFDMKTNQVIADSDGLLGDAWDGNVNEIVSCFVARDIVVVGDTTVIYGITNTTLKDFVQRAITKKVKLCDYNASSAVWIHEIRNYDGGKNYASCIVDPLDPSEEKRLLSTETVDVDGVRYLEKELKSLNESGTALYTYKERDKDGSGTPILVYSELYKDYNWVISMGSDMGDVSVSVETAQEKIDQFMIRFEILLSLLFILLIGVMAIMMIRTDREYAKQTTQFLWKKVQRDALTNATSRQFGEEKLKEYFEAFKKGKPSPAIMILDVDYFKDINDTYGHDVGDIILKRVVTSLYRTIRKSDYLIRWGGDEFVGVYLGLAHENIAVVAEKVVEYIHMVKVTLEDGQEISVTASIGFAEFAEGDTEYTDGLKRADNMLYDSKIGGRDQYHIAVRNAAIDHDKKSDSISRS